MLTTNRTRLPGTYWRLWTSSVASNLGDGLVLVAFPLLALSLTHRPVLVAGVAVAGQLPAFVLAPVAGALVDRWDRRRFALGIQITQLAVFCGFSVVVVAGADSLPLLYLAVAILGCLVVAFDSCSAAVLPALVGDDLERANGSLQAAQLTSREFVGQSLGGVTFAAARCLPFIVDAVSFAVAAVVLRGCLPASEPRGSHPPIGREIAEGMRWFAAHRDLRRLMAVIATFAGCQFAVTSLLALYSVDQLRTGRSGFGVLMAVAAVGGVAGALVAGRVTARVGARVALALGGVTAAGAYVLLSAWASAPVAGLALILEYAGVSVGNVASVSLRQRIIPAQLMGRVGSTCRMVVLGACAVGGLVGGVVAGWIGLRATFLAAAIVQLVVLAALTGMRSATGGAPIDLADADEVGAPIDLADELGAGGVIDLADPARPALAPAVDP